MALRNPGYRAAFERTLFAACVTLRVAVRALAPAVRRAFRAAVFTVRLAAAALARILRRGTAVLVLCIVAATVPSAEPIVRATSIIISFSFSTNPLAAFRFMFPPWMGWIWLLEFVSSSIDELGRAAGRLRSVVGALARIGDFTHLAGHFVHCLIDRLPGAFGEFTAGGNRLIDGVLSTFEQIVTGVLTRFWREQQPESSADPESYCETDKRLWQIFRSHLVPPFDSKAGNSF
jgi:hypothetical protein